MNGREYMKDMNTKQKIDYVWYYYKIHIIVAIVIIIFCGMFISDKINSKNYVFDFTVIGSSINSDIQNSTQKEATSLLLGKTDGKDQVLFDFILQSKNANGEVELGSSMQQKFVVKMAVGEIDVIALDKKLFSELASQGALVKLSDLNGLELNDAVEVSAKNKAGEENVYGIEISNSKKLKSMGYDLDNKILCVVEKTKNIDMSVKFVNWIIK